MVSKIEPKIIVQDILDNMFFNGDVKAWIMILCTIITIHSFILLIKHLLQDASKSFTLANSPHERPLVTQEYKEHRTGTSKFLYILLPLLYQGQPFPPRFVSQRISITCYLLCAMVLVISIFAFTKTSLIVTDANVIQTFCQLKAAKNYQVMISNRGQRLNTIQAMSSNNPEFQCLWQKLISDPRTTVFDNTAINEIILKLKKLMHEPTIVISDFQTIAMFGTVLCQLDNYEQMYFLTKSKLADTMFAYPIRRSLNESLKRTLMKRVKILVESGLEQYLYEQALVGGSWPTCVTERPENGAGQLEEFKISILKKTFSFWATGLSTSFVCFVIECWMKWKIPK